MESLGNFQASGRLCFVIFGKVNPPSAVSIRIVFWSYLEPPLKFTTIETTIKEVELPPLCPREPLVLRQWSVFNAIKVNK